MFDKNKIYGTTIEEAMAAGRFPKGNIDEVDGDDNQILTIEEIKRMFPEQYLYLTNVTLGEKGIFDIITASVSKYHCDGCDNNIKYSDRGMPENELPYSTFSYEGERLQEITSNRDYIEEHGCSMQEEFNRKMDAIYGKPTIQGIKNNRTVKNDCYNSKVKLEALLDNYIKN